MKVSIIVEWETVLEGKHSRGAACLASLRAQAAEHETIVCFDPAETDEAAVRNAIGPDWPGTLIVAPAPSHLDYYGKKNHGFTLSSGEVVIFLDSDLIPESDWLLNLTTPFADFRKSIIVGRTHLETSTIYERAVALFWIFDARDASPLRLTRRLVSNNIAFRRAVFKHFPFPERPTFRGQCTELGSMLEARGIVMYEQPSARASHPAPDGVRRFFWRAYAAGHDHAFYDALEGNATFARCRENFRTDRRHVRERIAERAPIIGARRRDILAARILGFAYYATKAMAYAAAVISDRTAPASRPNSRRSPPPSSGRSGRPAPSSAAARAR